MHATTARLRQTIDAATAQFTALSYDEWHHKPAPASWSKKEILGHLIDSAQNNLRRFVVAQYLDQPQVVYDQDFWVQAQRYQEAGIGELIELWRLLNRQLARTLDAMPEASWKREANTGRSEPELHTLEWIADDYVKHLHHHLRKMLPGGGAALWESNLTADY
jgi:hypothetical protein